MVHPAATCEGSRSRSLWPRGTAARSARRDRRDRRVDHIDRRNAFSCGTNTPDCPARGSDRDLSFEHVAAATAGDIGACEPTSTTADVADWLGLSHDRSAPRRPWPLPSAPSTRPFSATTCFGRWPGPDGHRPATLAVGDHAGRAACQRHMRVGAADTTKAAWSASSGSAVLPAAGNATSNVPMQHSVFGRPDAASAWR